MNDKGLIKEITYREAIDFLLPKHYSGRVPVVSKAFGWFFGGELCAVCTFGKPASPSLCTGICGKEYSDKVYELNRLCRVEHLSEPLSYFVSYCLRELKKEDWIIVSYSDTGMNHNGYIYQACNFLYTGRTKQRTDKWTEGNKHSRHYSNEAQGKYRKVRTSKNRYVYFCTSSKRTRKKYISALKYPILSYPKEENQNYVLGEYMQPILVLAE